MPSPSILRQRSPGYQLQFVFFDDHKILEY